MEHDTWPQHVWVDPTGRWAGREAPGILIAWRRTERGWEGWVITAERHSIGTSGSVTVRQGWVQAVHVRPAAARSPASKS